jgi:intein/homing endonuclease
LKTSINSKLNILIDLKRNRCRFNLSNKHFHETLISNGCTPQKSLTLKFPDIKMFSNYNLVVPFIRGYFDGDGCITHVYSGSKHKNKFVISASIVGTFDFLGQIKNILSKFNIHCNIYHDKRKHENT